MARAATLTVDVSNLAAEAVRRAVDELTQAIDDAALTGTPPTCGSCVHLSPDSLFPDTWHCCTLPVPANVLTDAEGLTVVYLSPPLVKPEHYCAAHTATPAPFPHPTVTAFEADLATLEGSPCDGTCPTDDPCPDCEA